MARVNEWRRETNRIAKEERTTRRRVVKRLKRQAIKEKVEK